MGLATSTSTRKALTVLHSTALDDYSDFRTPSVELALKRNPSAIAAAINNPAPPNVYKVAKLFGDIPKEGPYRERMFAATLAFLKEIAPKSWPLRARGRP